MKELELAKRFCEDIDRILQDNKAGITPAEPDREGYREAIELARCLAAVDLSDECRIAGDLRRRLLDRLSASGKKQGAERESTELGDDELDNVAGGINRYRDQPPEE
ncbi:MAG: hypothetical protein ACOY46_08855 [Bacillota bacterium]